MFFRPMAGAKSKKAKGVKLREKGRGFLEHLFGSRTRVKLLRLFLRNPERQFYVREMAREVGAQIHAVRRELERFEGIRLLRAGVQGGDPSHPKKRFYILNQAAPLHEELRALVLRSQVFAEQDLVLALRGAGKIGAIFFCGAFVGDGAAISDVLVVGRMDRGKLRGVMEKFNKEVGFDIRYTIMSPSEFKYRRDVADRFLLGILDGKHVLGYNGLPAFLPAGEDGEQAEKEAHIFNPYSAGGMGGNLPVL